MQCLHIYEAMAQFLKLFRISKAVLFIHIKRFYFFR